MSSADSINQNEMKITQHCESCFWSLQFYGLDTLEVLDVKVVNYLCGEIPEKQTVPPEGTVCFPGISA